MVQLILSSASLEINQNLFITPSYISVPDPLNPGNFIERVPYDYLNKLYGSANFKLNTVITKPGAKKLRLKAFKATYVQMTNEKYYNNHLTYENITDNTIVRYNFPVQKFNDEDDYITYLNATCTDLNFVLNDGTLPNPNLLGDKITRVTVNHVDPTKEWRFLWDGQSISRSMGFDLGATYTVPPGGKITGLTPFTCESIGKLFISLQVGTKSFSNINNQCTYIVYAESFTRSTLSNYIDVINFVQNLEFDQYVEVTSSQYNNLIVSIYDEFGNIVYLNGHYTIILELDD
jgi:hypothetical protein